MTLIAFPSILLLLRKLSVKRWKNWFSTLMTFWLHGGSFLTWPQNRLMVIFFIKTNFAVERRTKQFQSHFSFSPLLLDFLGPAQNMVKAWKKKDCWDDTLSSSVSLGLTNTKVVDQTWNLAWGCQLYLKVDDNPPTNGQEWVSDHYYLKLLWPFSWELPRPSCQRPKTQLQWTSCSIQ